MYSKDSQKTKDNEAGTNQDTAISIVCSYKENLIVAIFIKVLGYFHECIFQWSTSQSDSFPNENFPSGYFLNVQFPKRQLPKG